jgi:hypothetical protein
LPLESSRPLTLASPTTTRPGAGFQAAAKDAGWPGGEHVIVAGATGSLPSHGRS